jgi:hypothetical protein
MGYYTWVHSLAPISVPQALYCKLCTLLPVIFVSCVPTLITRHSPPVPDSTHIPCSCMSGAQAPTPIEGLLLRTRRLRIHSSPITTTARPVFIHVPSRRTPISSVSTRRRVGRTKPRVSDIVYLRDITLCSQEEPGRRSAQVMPPARPFSPVKNGPGRGTKNVFTGEREDGRVSKLKPPDRKYRHANHFAAVSDWQPIPRARAISERNGRRYNMSHE